MTRVWDMLTTGVRRVVDRIRQRRWRPPKAGVREPRRPKPTLPAAAVALAEPRTEIFRRVKLSGWVKLPRRPRS